jgi:hypothetical protein
VRQQGALFIHSLPALLVLAVNKDPSEGCKSGDDRSHSGRVLAVCYERKAANDGHLRETRSTFGINVIRPAEALGKNKKSAPLRIL